MLKRLPLRTTHATETINRTLRSEMCSGCGKCCRGITIFSFSKQDPMYSRAVELERDLDKARKYGIIMIDINDIFTVIRFDPRFTGKCGFLGPLGCYEREYRPVPCREFPFLIKPTEEDGKPKIFLAEYCPPLEELKRNGVPYLFEPEVLGNQVLRESLEAIKASISKNNDNLDVFLNRDAQGTIVFPIVFDSKEFV
ncbi:MAG: YkgJ family cysteine cluster protein [Candidatus ainarchaeum sp.]|nr:YkgJ family cysteine cluster protein [Candidatus ainarchaeum sp.]